MMKATAQNKVYLHTLHVNYFKGLKSSVELWPLASQGKKMPCMIPPWGLSPKMPCRVSETNTQQQQWETRILANKTHRGSRIS